MFGCASKLTQEASPLCNDLQAMSTADKLPEQAVLTWMLGPRRSKYQLTRLGMTHATELPVAAVRSVFSGSMATRRALSSSIEAEKTAVREPLSFSTGIPATRIVSLIMLKMLQICYSPFSKARYDSSKVHRCIGSIAAASSYTQYNIQFTSFELYLLLVP
jgi:hypothetical protein